MCHLAAEIEVSLALEGGSAQLAAAESEAELGRSHSHSLALVPRAEWELVQKCVPGEPSPMPACQRLRGFCTVFNMFLKLI